MSAVFNHGHLKHKSDLVNAKENVLPVGDKPYHTNNIIQQKWAEIKSLRNYAMTT